MLIHYMLSFGGVMVMCGLVFLYQAVFPGPRGKPEADVRSKRRTILLSLSLIALGVFSLLFDHL